jgi:hypothetical protein
MISAMSPASSPRTRGDLRVHHPDAPDLLPHPVNEHDRRHQQPSMPGVGVYPPACRQIFD